jgi:hypothetical protein
MLNFSSCQTGNRELSILTINFSSRDKNRLDYFGFYSVAAPIM